jgi:deoxyribodipyrimidine photo-lyase
MEVEPKLDITRIIVLLRNDIRLADNYALTWAVNFNHSKEVLPVFCFDPKFYHPTQSQTQFGTRRSGKLRCKFIIEAVKDLREQLMDINSNLLVTN